MLSFQQAAASSIGYGVLYTDILIFIPSSTRRALAVSASTSVSYQVYAANTQFASSTAAYNAMSASLTASASDGLFTSYLVAYGQSNGVNLNSVSSGPLSVSSLITPTSAPTSSSNSGLSQGAVAAIVIAIIFVVACLVMYVAWIFTRKTIVVAGLPPQFVENDLMVSLPGAISVKRMDNMVCAFVEFETHAMAVDLVERSKKELVYFQNSTLVVRYAYPCCFESMVGPPSAPQSASHGGATTNPTFTRNEFGVKPGSHLDDDRNM